MKLFGTIALTITYYVAILMAGLWYGFKAIGLVLIASLCVAIVSHLIEKDDECQDDEDFPEYDSCDGCVHNLGGGCCAINVEHECREGGGFELYTEELR